MDKQDIYQNILAPANFPVYCFLPDYTVKVVGTIVQYHEKADKEYDNAWVQSEWRLWEIHWVGRVHLRSWIGRLKPRINRNTQ